MKGKREKSLPCHYLSLMLDCSFTVLPCLQICDDLCSIGLSNHGRARRNGGYLSEEFPRTFIARLPTADREDGPQIGSPASQARRVLREQILFWKNLVLACLPISGGADRVRRRQYDMSDAFNCLWTEIITEKVEHFASDVGLISFVVR